MSDTMNITILDDGTIKVETDKVSQANHMTAESFLRNISKACGAVQRRKHKQGVVGAFRHSIQHAIGKAHHH